MTPGEVDGSHRRQPPRLPDQRDPLDHRVDPFDTSRGHNSIVLEWDAQLLPAPLRNGGICEQLDGEEVAGSYLVSEPARIEEGHRRSDPMPPVAHGMRRRDELRGRRVVA